MAKTAAERKADRRKREAEHLKAVGAEAFNITMFKGTHEALERIMSTGEFEEAAEALTVLIHNIDEILIRDMSQKINWLDVARLSRRKSSEQ